MPDAAIVPDSELARTDSASRAQAENMKTVRFVDFRQEPEAKSEYTLYVYNIAPRSFQIRRPPNFPLITFAACPAGQPYVLVGTVPSIVYEKWIDADAGEVRRRGMQGERFIMDIINPANTGIDMWAELVDDAITWIDGGTDDMSRRGLFWSRNNPPTSDELAKTKARLEKHYKLLITQADELFRNNQAREIGKEHHLAAEYYHVRSNWHTVAELPEFCPNCGTEIRKDVAFHVLPNGQVCIIDPSRAAKAGIRSVTV